MVYSRVNRIESLPHTMANETNFTESHLDQNLHGISAYISCRIVQFVLYSNVNDIIMQTWNMANFTVEYR